MDIPDNTKEIRRMKVCQGSGTSGRIYVPKSWCGEEVMVMRMGTPIQVIPSGDITLEETLDGEGIVAVIPTGREAPTRVLLPRGIINPEVLRGD